MLHQGLAHSGGKIFSLYFSGTDTCMATCSSSLGDSILLWKDKWKGHVPLVVSYDMMFSFVYNKDISIQEAM
jgi:hypothetical protein